MCNITIEIGIISEDWITVAIIPLYKSKGKRIGVVGEICVYRICRMTDEWTDNEHSDSSTEKESLNQIFTIKKIVKKHKR